MFVDDTNVDTTPDEQGKKDVDTEGTLDTATGKDKEQEEKKEVKQLTQAQIDEIVKSAKRDAKAAAKKEFDKGLEGKKVLTEEELTKYVNEAVNTALEQKALETAKASLQTEYDLTEVQVARLQGDTIDELRADAELLYGKPKKKAPTLLPGVTGDKREAKDNDEEAIAVALNAAIKRVR